MFRIALRRSLTALCRQPRVGAHTTAPFLTRIANVTSTSVFHDHHQHHCCRYFATTPEPEPEPEPELESVHVEPEPKKTQRLNRRLADGLLCSRRQADVLLQECRVRVNGVVVTEGVVTDDDEVTLDNKPVAKAVKTTQVWLAHKLGGELVSRNDPQGRPTIMERLAQMGLPKGLKYVGR